MYFLAQNNEKTGPFTLAQLREMWRTGAVYPQTLYWEEGLANWQPLERIASTVLLPTGEPALPPSAYDLPAFHLPAAPVGPNPVSPMPPAALVPAPIAPVGTHALITPTGLPPGNMGTAVGPLRPVAPEMPPSAYLSLVFAILGPGLCLVGHGAGALPGLGMAIAAVICGHSARAAIVASGNRRPGAGFATTGLCVGYGCLGLAAVVILVLMVVVVFGAGAMIHSIIVNGSER